MKPSSTAKAQRQTSLGLEKLIISGMKNIKNNTAKRIISKENNALIGAFGNRKKQGMPVINPRSVPNNHSL